ncbi:hypothetical protein TrLO_g8001 [Triparma laevis f. longispina]|uniref:START domain-containing protein n=1 Tax=Triparma laevis f. longispina TaxID=1714387 RepID=A0A9W7E1N7_9STRA|nr:hypothetical protein TrLO_g8001 [Triparma laevis f. longispina]
MIGLNLNNSSVTLKADKLFCKTGALLYERFKKEHMIDERRKKDLIENIDDAPPLTEGEQKLIAGSMKVVEENISKAKRIAGTVSESVEKYIYHSEEGGATVGMIVAKMDLSAVSLFAELWLLDTYSRKAKNKDARIYEVWNNLDGTRVLQFTTSVGLPRGFQDRLLEIWVTWKEMIDEKGRRTFIIAFAPLETYEGTHHEVSGAKKMVEATSTGVHIIKELSESTCELMSAQQSDFKFSSAIPLSVLDFVAKQPMNYVNEIQKKFRHNGKEVDRERAAALAREMIERRGEPLMADQMAVFNRSEELLGDGRGEMWKALGSTNPDVEMSIKYIPPKEGERSVATGKGVGLIDCSAEEAAAWVMDHCSNDKMRNHKEIERNPARLELRHLARVNEATFATVVRFPFRLDDREFVFRMIWKSEMRRVMIALESVRDEVDYGMSFKKTRGFVRSTWLFEDLPERGGVKQCRATFVTQLDAGGIIPIWVVDKKVPVQLGAVHALADEFRQDEKVDSVEVGVLATFIRERWKDEVYSEEENALLERARQKFEGSFKEGKVWTRLKSPDVFVKMEATFEKGGSVALVGRAATVVEATIEDCAAWELTRMTRERVKDHYKFGGVDRKVDKLSYHSDMYYFAVDFGIKSFALREWLVKFVWKMVDENTMIVGYEDTEDDNFPIGVRKKYVRASSGAFWKYERLPEVSGTPQTRVTYCQQVDLKGFMPLFVMNSRIVQTLEYLSTMRKKFDKSLEIDAGQRAEIVKKIKREEEVGGLEASAQFEALFEERQGSERPSRKFELTDSKVQASAVGGKGWGSTRVKVRAEMEEVAAFFWDFGSRANMEISGDVERTLEEDEEGAGAFKKIVKRRQQMSSSHGSHHRHRKFNSEMKLRRVDREIIGVSIYFQRLIPLKEYKVEDGIALANDLLWMTSSGKKRIERLKEVLTRSRAMRELTETLPWVEVMLVPAVRGNLNINRAVSTKLVCVSEKEAAQIGRNLIPALKSKKLVNAGVDQWKVQNRAIRELMKKYTWFEPMIVEISKGIVKTAPWGLMWRVALGAVLSLGDLVTDLIVLK